MNAEISPTEEILALFEKRGNSEYGGESVTQLEHALQAAMMAEREQAPATLVAAALLHDVGHLLHDLPEDAPDQGVDDHHENSAAHYLERRFPEAVVAPVRMHVDAKRYLCATDPSYFSQLSRPSVVSLELQGGLMNAEEIAEFETRPFYREATRLRRWDDAAKIPGLQTPSLQHFAKYVSESSLEARRDNS